MSLAASVTVSNRMLEWLYQTEFLLPNSYQVNPLGYLMCISLTSWKDGIIQLMPGGLVMFYSSLIHILGRKLVTLDEEFDTTYSWKLCVWMGQDEAECHRVGNVLPVLTCPLWRLQLPSWSLRYWVCSQLCSVCVCLYSSWQNVRLLY